MEKIMIQRTQDAPAKRHIIYLPTYLRDRVAEYRAQYATAHGLKTGELPTLADFYLHFAGQGVDAIKDGYANPVFSRGADKRAFESGRADRSHFVAVSMKFPPGLKAEIAHLKNCIKDGAFEVSGEVSRYFPAGHCTINGVFSTLAEVGLGRVESEFYAMVFSLAEMPFRVVFPESKLIEP